MIANPTAAQLAQVSTYVVQLRATLAQFAQAMAQMNALQNYYNQTVSAILNPTTGVTVVDSTGLAGAVPLTDTQVVTLTADIEAVLTTYYTTTYQELFAAACGPGNVL